MKAYIRVCPVCETENPPDRIHCSCGTLLAGVDFSLPAQAKVGEAPPQTVMPELPPELLPELPSELPPPPSPQAEIIAAPASKADTSAQTVVCSAPDCGQINPAGERRCLYCNRPLAAPVPITTVPDIFKPTLALPRHGATFASTRRINLPSALAEKYRIISELQAAGSEADLLIVEPLEGGIPWLQKFTVGACGLMPP